MCHESPLGMACLQLISEVMYNNAAIPFFADDVRGVMDLGCSEVLAMRL
jgi:hypothetical protein